MRKFLFAALWLTFPLASSAADITFENPSVYTIGDISVELPFTMQRTVDPDMADIPKWQFLNNHNYEIYTYEGEDEQERPLLMATAVIYLNYGSAQSCPSLEAVANHLFGLDDVPIERTGEEQISRSGVTGTEFRAILDYDISGSAPMQSRALVFQQGESVYALFLIHNSSKEFESVMDTIARGISFASE